MKKNRFGTAGVRRRALLKLLFSMKLSILFLTVSFMQVSAHVYSQDTFSFDLRQVSADMILSKIQKESAYRFFYTRDDIRKLGRVDLQVRDAPLATILHQILPAGMTYRFMGEKRVVISSLRDINDQITVRGVVTDSTGSPLVGVTVKVKGQNVGVVTDASGAYTIVVPDDAVLEFSYVGYEPREVPVSGQTQINVALTANVSFLNQLVVVGYGAVKKKDLTGAVATVSRKDIGDIAVSSIGQMVQGKLSGVSVINRNGLPGSGVDIQIRGVGTINNTTPLYIIDGIKGDINSIAPDQIESITVLKDASAGAIYGAEAANGVVLVTTKKGEIGAPKVSYSGYVGFAQPWKKLDMLNATQYLDLVDDIVHNADPNAQLPPKLTSDYAKVDRTNWQDAIFRTALLTEHNIGVSGGTEKILYNAGLSYSNQDAIMIGYNYQRINFRVNTEINFGKIRAGESLNFRYSVRDGSAPSFTDALRMPPYAPIYDSTNLGGYYKVTTTDDLNDAFNPYAAVYLKTSKNREFSTFANLWAEWQIIPELKYRIQGALSFSNNNQYDYTRANYNGNLYNPNIMNETYGWGINQPILENTLTFSKAFGIHNLTVMAGNSFRKGGISRSASMSGSDFTNDEVQNLTLAGQSSFKSENIGNDAFISYFGRLNYSLKDRYLLTANFRADGSPNFGPANRFGYFPSVAVAWKVNEEPFFSGVQAVSELKLRGGWGKAGNDLIPGFSYVSNIFTGSSNNIVYPTGVTEAETNGATINSLASPNIKWETTTSTDIGVDLGLWQSKLTLTADYYHRRTDNILVQVPISPSTGIDAIPYKNAASVLNQGVELSVGYAARVGEVRIQLSANGAYNKNKVVSLGSGEPFLAGSTQDANTITRTEEGYPIGYFYGYKVDHVFVDQADVDHYNEIAQKASGNPDATYQAAAAPGDICFKDINGDGVVTDADRTLIGNPIPKYSYGFSASAQYNGFDFALALEGVSDVDLYNSNLRYWLTGMIRPFNSTTEVLKRWKQPGDVTSVPRAINGDPAKNLRPSDRFVENGSYMRIRNVTLGYSLPGSLFNGRLGKTVSSVRIYVTAQNLFTFTDYSGYDPEVSAQDPNNTQYYNTMRGIDVGQYPQPRSFLFGLQVGF